MQRKPTKNTRGPNAEEKRFQGWVKQQFCCWCGSESGSIVDHVMGATFRHNKTLIGHRFVLPNCAECDYKKTELGQKLGDYTEKWTALHYEYSCETGNLCPIEVFDAIQAWGGTWQNGRL